MWSTPSDRERARWAVETQRLSPAQQRAKDERQHAFEAGFDKAVRHLWPSQWPEPDWTSHRYSTERAEFFERWDLEQRTNAYEAK
jgi:hypothetical protein